MNAENFGRYENAEAWDLVQQLDQTPVDDVEGMKAITSQLQTHPAHGPAHHPALVQRHVVAGQ